MHPLLLRDELLRELLRVLLEGLQLRVVSHELAVRPLQICHFLPQVEYDVVLVDRLLL
jgi:hypothetical protein